MQVINVIYDGAFCAAHPCVPGQRAMGGRTRRRWRTGGGGCDGEGEKMNEAQRNWEEPPQQNFSNNRATGTTAWASLLFCAHGCSDHAKITCAVKSWVGGRRGWSPLAKMDHVTRTRSRRRTALFVFILLHVTASRAGKVSVWTPAVNKDAVDEV